MDFGDLKAKKVEPEPTEDIRSNTNMTAQPQYSVQPLNQSKEIELQELVPQAMGTEMSDLVMMQLNEPLEQDLKLDKGSASSFIDQSIVDHRIQTSVITPMDHVTIAQTLQNPHPDHQDEIITVQIVYQHLKIDDGTTLKDKRPQEATCNSKHPLKQFNFYAHGLKKACNLCRRDISNGTKHYSCKEKDAKNKLCNYDCCAKCMLGFELRRQLENKTLEHNLVQLQYLHQTVTTLEQTQQKLHFKERMVVHEIISVQEMPITEDTKEPEPETIPYKSKHAIIGLWRRNNSGYIECYRQFRIDNPVTQKRFLGKAQGEDEDFKLKPLFYVGDRGGIYYFTQTQTLDFSGAKKKQLSYHLQQFDLASACRSNISQLKLYHRNLYFPPLVRDKQACGNVVDQLLSNTFSKLLDNRKPTLSPFEPQFLESAGYLAVTVDKAVPFSDNSPSNLVETKQHNIFFCSLDKPSKIDKVIYNGCVVLKVNMNGNQIIDVWYSCAKNLNQIAWNKEVDPSQLTREFLKASSPKQQLSQCYAFSGKTPAEDIDVKKNLADYLGSKALCTQVQGIMHFNDQRVSFVFTNLDFMTFQINKEKNQAVLVWGNDKKTDSRFCFSKGDGLLICFDLYHEEVQEREKDANSFIMDFRDLNAKLVDYSTKKDLHKEQDLRRRQLKIEFKIGNNLCIHDKFSEDKKLPYQFTDFRIKQIEENKQEFTVSLHFVDADTYQPNLYFLQGQNMVLGYNDQCTNQVFLRKQAATEYPILIQNTWLPLQNQLLVANLSLNTPQKLIDLGDYRFICFVETGLQSISFPFLENNHASIFFLALSPSGHIKLMQFQTFPWLVNENNFELNQKGSVIKIFSGFIVTSLANPTKIKGAALLYHKGLNDSDLLIKIAIQFYDNIEVYSLTNPVYLKLLNPIESQLLEEKTVKLHMVCNQNLIYYVKRYGMAEDKVICVHHNGPDIAELVVYSSSCQILQLQTKQDAVPNDKEQSLYIIDSQSRFIEIQCNMKDLTFEVVNNVQMTRAGNIIQKLKNQRWQKLVFSSRSITTSFLKDSQDDLWKGVITYNLISGSKSKHDFLGYKADGEITAAVGKANKSVNQILTNCQVFSVQHLAGIGKILLTVQEAKVCYYLLMQSLDNRRIDLFSHQPTQNLQRDVTLINNTITAKMEGQILVFCHNDLMQKQTYNFKTLKQSLGTFQQIQSNYVLIDKEVVDEESSKSNLVDMVSRINTDGSFTTIFSSVKSFIFKQKNAINKELLTKYKAEAEDEERCWIPNQFPAYFVTSKGTLVQPFLLKRKEIKQNLVDNGETMKIVSEEMCTFKVVKYDLPYEKILVESALADAGVNYLKEDEKNVVVYILKNESLKSTDLRFRQTPDFLVVLGRHKIFFKKIASINEAVEKAQANLASRSKNSSVSKEGRPVIQMGNFAGFQGIKALIESKECQFEFECIDFSQLFTEKQQQGRYKMVVMSESQELVFAGKQHINVIQISFQDIIVLWDLDDNQELSQMPNFNQFSTPETMIPSPFNISTKCSLAEDTIVTDSLIKYTSDHNIFVQNTQGNGDNVFKLYTMLDLLEIKAIHRNLLQETFKNSIPIDPESVLAFIHGKSFFQLFQDHPEVISSFLNQLQALDLPKFIDEDEVESDNIYIRRLFRTLKAKTAVEDEDGESLISKRYQSKNFEPPQKSEISILQSALQNKENRSSLFLDALLQIELFSSEVNINSMITNFEDFKKVINIQSKWVSAFMEQVFKTNAQTEEVQNIPWDHKQKMVVFGSDNSQLSSEEIVRQAYKQMMKTTRVDNLHAQLIGLLNKCKTGQKLQSPTLKLQQIPVTVKIIEISWLAKNLRDFYIFVTCQNDETLYDMELIRVLLTCQDYSAQLIYRAFLPYTILMGTVLYYFSVCVNVPHTEGFFGGDAVGLRCFIFAYQLIFCAVEVVQMISLKQNYLTDHWNYVYLLEYAITYLVIIEHSTNFIGIDQNQLSQFTACCTVLLWTILFYWMRIFSDLGFYVYLILETLRDTKHFLILVMMVLITFANALYILEIANHAEASVSDDTALAPTADGETTQIDQLIQRAYNSTFIDSVVNQYLLGLGEFQYDAFASNPAGPLIWSLFLLSTFLTQVTFMNMLVAIMSDTFARVLANEQRYGLEQKTMITTDFIYALTLSKKITSNRYLYIIEPANTSERQDAMESSLANLKKSLASENTKLGDLVRQETNKATSGMLTQVQLISKQMANLQQGMDAKVDALQEQMSAIQGALEKLNQRLN